MLYRDYAKDKYQNAFQLSNAEGVPCVLKGSKGKKIRNYELYGNSVQDGTPSIENPVEIQSVGDLVTDTESEHDVPITVTGTRIETTHIYLDEPLRKIGDYADYIDFKNQKVVRKVKEKIFYGTERFSDKYIASNSITYRLPHLADSVAMLTRSIWHRTATIWANNTYLVFDASYYGVTTLDEFKTKLAEWYTNGEPLKMYYVLDTSTEENISLPALKTFKDTNLISSDSTISSSNIKAKYIKK